MKLPFFLARRFVSAETLEGSFSVAESLRQRGLSTTLDHLGEYISDPDLARQALDEYVNLLDAMARQDGLDRNISIKLSMLGQNIDESFCLDNLRFLLEKAHDTGAFVRLDMEGSDVTSSTIGIFESVHTDYPGNVGIVLQAYLKRTREDIQNMCERGARVRLCKGAYREPAAIAFQKMTEIRDRYIEYTQVLLTEGDFPAIATHDDILIDSTKEFVSERQIGKDRFEFQMLYGMRPETQAAIASEGFGMRVYVPYGKMWFPYYSRRLRERKENIFFLFRNLVRK
jgi:proline dehydrogenase